MRNLSKLVTFCTAIISIHAIAAPTTSNKAATNTPAARTQAPAQTQKAFGFVQSEFEYRHFKYDFKNTPTGKYDAVERNWKIFQSSLALTPTTSLWTDLRRIDYFDDKSGSMTRTGWGWDHEASLSYHAANPRFWGKDWRMFTNFGWEGDWNYNTQNKLNWSSQDYYVWVDLKTTFDNGLTPWDRGKHNLNFRPLLVEYIKFGESSKFHSLRGQKGGSVWGNRNQFLSFFLGSQWTDKLSTNLSFRNYADLLAEDGIQYHIGTEDYLKYTIFKHDSGIYFDWNNKLELYALMDDADKTGKDRFTEFYTRLRLGYETQFDNKIKLHAYIGQDLWNYHYNDRPWVKGEYSRNETIGAIKITVPIGG